MTHSAAGALPNTDGSKGKLVDVDPGGVVILPAMPAGSTVRVRKCGRAGVKLYLESSDQSVYLWVADRQGSAISLENRACAAV